MLVLFALGAPSASGGHPVAAPGPVAVPPGEMPPVGLEVARKDWTWTLVDERGLALGGGGLEADDAQDLHERGFRAVLNYRVEWPEEDAIVREVGMEYLHVATGHAEEDTMALAEVVEAVAFIEENLDAGRPVYVHCIGGWHRSLVGVVAYFMKTRGWRYDEAFAHVAHVRPGVEPRFADALLEYEAHLFEEPKLTVDLWTERWDVAPNETVLVEARVTLHGAPVENATLRWAADHAPQQGETQTDAQGRASFPFSAVSGPLVQFVHAQASKEGLVDGYDRNVFWVREAKHRLPTVLELEGWAGPTEPGAEVAFVVRASETDGAKANVRVTVTTPCATLHRDYVGWDGEARIAFSAPSRNGTYPILVSATRFPAEPVDERLELVVGSGGPMPPCEMPKEDEASAADAAREAMSAAGLDLGARETLAGALGLAAAGALLAGVGWRRRA